MAMTKIGSARRPWRRRGSAGAAFAVAAGATTVAVAALGVAYSYGQPKAPRNSGSISVGRTAPQATTAVRTATSTTTSPTTTSPTTTRLASTTVPTPPRTTLATTSPPASAVGPLPLTMTCAADGTHRLGESLTISYVITGDPQQIVLGASLANETGRYYSDAGNDRTVVLVEGIHTYTRVFKIPADASLGEFNVIGALFDPKVSATGGEFKTFSVCGRVTLLPSV